MAKLAATISDVRIKDQQLVGRISVEGDVGGYGEGQFIVYDAGGTERHRTDLGRMESGQPWDLQLDVEGRGLEDGDYAAWIYVILNPADDSIGDVVSQGVSFLVGRGEVYPSGEVSHKRPFEHPVEALNIRLEGSWIVFDMKNTERYDVEVVHTLVIVNDATTPHSASGEELVRAGATQQGHYLLPEHMVDGRYLVSVVVQSRGSDVQNPVWTYIEVNDGVVTVNP